MDKSTIQEFGRRLNYYCQHGLKAEQPPHQDHQVEAHQAIIEDLAGIQKPEDFWSLMVMATGSGKSFTAGKEIKAFNTPQGAQCPVWDHPALIVTSRLMLTDQFKRDLAKNTGIQESDIGGLSSKSKAPSQMEKPVLIVPYPTFLNLSKAGVLTPENRPLLVLDEAHNAIGSKAMQEIKKNWVGKSYIQCWTATDKMPRKTVAQVLFNSKTGQDVDDATYRLPLKEAAERGITAPLKSMVLETEFTSGAKPTEAGNLRDEDMEKIVNQKGRMQALIRLCHGDYTEKFGVDFCGMKTIVFAPGIEHGKKLAEEFNNIFGPGYAVAVSGAETKPHELDTTKEGSIAWRFTRGDRAQHDPVVFITDKLVEEGVDLPAAELAVEEVPTFSERVETQRVGRVVRRVNGKNAYSVVMLDKDQEGAAIIGEMEGWELKPKEFEFPKAAEQKKGPAPSSLPPDYPDIAVHVVADAREIAEFRERKLTAIVKDKPAEGFLTNEEFGRLLKAVIPKMKNPALTAKYIIGDIRSQLTNNDTAYYKEVPVTGDALDEYEYNSMPAYALREAECKAIAAKYAIIKDKLAEGFLVNEEFGRLLKAAKPALKDPAAKAVSIVADIRNQLRTKKVAYYKRVPITEDALDEYQYHNRPAYALHEAECRAIAAKYATEQQEPSGSPEKDDAPDVPGTSTTDTQPKPHNRNRRQGG